MNGNASQPDSYIKYSRCAIQSSFPMIYHTHMTTVAGSQTAHCSPVSEALFWSFLLDASSSLSSN